MVGSRNCGGVKSNLLYSLGAFLQIIHFYSYNIGDIVNLATAIDEQEVTSHRLCQHTQCIFFYTSLVGVLVSNPL